MTNFHEWAILDKHQKNKFYYFQYTMTGPVNLCKICFQMAKKYLSLLSIYIYIYMCVYTYLPEK